MRHYSFLISKHPYENKTAFKCSHKAKSAPDNTDNKDIPFPRIPEALTLHRWATGIYWRLYEWQLETKHSCLKSRSLLPVGALGGQ